MFKAHSVGCPLNAWELKVLEGTHSTEPMGLLGGEVGLEKHTKPNNNKITVLLHVKTLHSRNSILVLLPNIL